MTFALRAGRGGKAEAEARAAGMFDNLSCLTDAVSVLDFPPARAGQIDCREAVRAANSRKNKRIASVSSLTSMDSLATEPSPRCSPLPCHQLLVMETPLGTYEQQQHHQPPLPRAKAPRKRISQEQTDALQSLFDGGVHFPTRELRERLARQLALTCRTVQVWFQNRRQAARNRQRGDDRPLPGQKLAIRWMKPIVFNAPPAPKISNPWITVPIPSMRETRPVLHPAGSPVEMHPNILSDGVSKSHQ